MSRFTIPFLLAAENAAPPSTGELRLDGAALDLVEVAWASFSDALALDAEDNLLSANEGDVLTIASIEHPERFAKYQLAQVNGLGTYVEFQFEDEAIDTGNAFSTPEAVTLHNEPVATGSGAVYATVEELAGLLRLTTPTATQIAAMDRVLLAAAEEIDWELGYTAVAPAPDPPPALVVEVNLERAVEHWRQSYSPFGVIGVGSEQEPVVTARNSWYRHHLKLAPLKTSYGVA